MSNTGNRLVIATPKGDKVFGDLASAQIIESTSAPDAGGALGEADDDLASYTILTSTCHAELAQVATDGVCQSMWWL